MRFFSIGNHKKCKPNHYILLLPIFHNLEMIQFWSVNYICLVYKLKFLFWTCLKFWAIFMADLQLLHSCICSAFWRLWKLFDCGFLTNNFQNLIFMFSCYPKIQQNFSPKHSHNSGVVTRRKLPNPSLSNVFILLSIGLRYALSF